MLNLLPQKEKEELIQEESFKLVLVLGILILIFLICLSLILFSIGISIGGQLAIEKALLSQKETEISHLRDLEKEIKNLNLTFSKLNSFYQKNPNFVKILEITSKTLLPGTYLTSFNFNPLAKDKKYLGEVILNGYSPTREILLEFKKNLEQEELFQEVYFPPANWVEPTDINFTVNFKIKWQ